MKNLFSHRTILQLTVSLAVATLAACGGGGADSSGESPSQAQSGNQNQSSNSEPTPGNPPQTSLASTLFIGLRDRGVIASVDGMLKPGAQLPADRLLPVYPAVEDKFIMDIGYDSTNDRVYAVDNRRIITAFKNAKTAENGAQPAQKVLLADSGFQPTSMAIDAVRGHFYLSGFQLQSASSEKIVVFGVDASGAISTAPVREFTDGRVYDDSRTQVGNTNPPMYVRRYIYEISLDAERDIAYVMTSSMSEPRWAINVFKNASTLSGKRYPDQIIDLQDASVTNTSNIQSVTKAYIDSKTDTLYFGFMPGTIGVINNASTRSGKILSDKYIVLPSKSWLRVAIDSKNDRMYASGSEGIFAVDKVSSASGTVPGIGMLLSDPSSLDTARYPIAVAQ